MNNISKTQDPLSPCVILLSHAGGSSASYLSCFPKLSQALHVLAIDLPGHGAQFSEKPLKDIESMLDFLEREIQAKVPQGPLYIFGHSMGGLLAYLLAERELKQGAMHRIKKLVISCCFVPGYTRLPAGIDSMSSKEFWQLVKRFNGMPDDLLESDELCQLFMPTLMADFSAIRAYPKRPLTSLPIPVTLVAATGDEFTVQEQLAWREVSSLRFRIHRLPGNHFYFLNNPRALETLLLKEFQSPSI